jgi:hypothetical protein
MQIITDPEPDPGGPINTELVLKILNGYSTQRVI